MSAALEREYTICEEIGRGKYGVVSRCYSNATGECFAVKSIGKRRIQDDDVDRLCLDNEAKIMQLVRGHQNVVGIVEIFDDDEFMHVVMEHCGSKDLFGRISGCSGFDEDETRRIMMPLMEAISHCHRHGISHRDIKPDNILFNSHNELKLADFGSAEIFSKGGLMSGIVGTPYYVAPEVVAGRDYNEKVDVWSAGVIMYVLLSGIPPFYGETPQQIFEAVHRANLRFPSRVFSSVSSEAKDLLRRMLYKDVSKRYSTEQVLKHPWMTVIKESRESIRT